MKPNVKIFDDETGLADRYAKPLKDASSRFMIDVSTISLPEFRVAMNGVTAKYAQLRKKTRAEEKDPRTELDKVDILVVDYDLVKVYEDARFLTGEDVCYVLRSSTDCGLLIGLNQFGHNPYDLTLRGDPESYADLNIGQDQLANAGLWSGHEEFGPWSWPRLPQYLRDFRWKIDEVLKHLELPIIRMLQLERIQHLFTKRTKSFLGSKLELVEPRHFVLKSKKGLRPKDRYPSEAAIARMTAARISKWLETMVLPGQDLLVDAPHLVSRFPSLLKGPPDKVESWNKTAQFATVDKLGIDYKRIEDFRYKNDHWISRPAWFWNDLVGFNEIDEVAHPLKREKVPFVFAEDSGRFFRRETCREFTPEIDSAYLRRYVRYFTRQGIEYSPKSCFN